MSDAPTEAELARYAAGDCADDEARAIAARLKDHPEAQAWVERERANAAWLARVRPAAQEPATDESPVTETGSAAEDDTIDGPPRPTGSTPNITGYRITRELKRGGQVAVYQAIQLSTKRKVAIKVPFEGVSTSGAVRRRFKREIELVAQLKHPNIIAIFDSGVASDGRQFFVMDYVRGQPLHTYVRERKLTLEETLRLFARICDAVQYAHLRGVIHRDLKPSNILIDIDGNPKVLDFGLAKTLTAPLETALSISQEVVGTLPYMSPEQTHGNPEEIDTRTDIYALGVVLYELLTGHYPYPVIGAMVDILRNIAETPPTPPSRQWTPDSGVTRRSSGRQRPGQCPIDDDVQTIVLKALAKERDRRYQSASELARDISHYLVGEPIEAKRDSFLYMAGKSFRRHRRNLLTLGAVTVVAMLALYFGLHSGVRREHARSMVAAQKIAEAQACFDAGFYIESLSLLAELDAYDRGVQEVTLLRAQALRALGRASEAVAELRRFLTVSPREAAACALLADLLRADHPEEAARLAASVREYQKDTAEDYYLCALAESEPNRAILWLTRAIVKSARMYDALMARAAHYCRQERFLDAEVDATCARKLRPNDPRPWELLGAIWAKLGRRDEALAALRHATSLDPNSAATWSGVGVAYELLKVHDQAVAAHQQAVKLDAQSAYRWFHLGRAFQGDGDSTNAEAAWQRAVSIDPTQFASNYQLALCADRRRQDDEAEERYRRCLTLPHADRSAVSFALGAFLARMGRLQEAMDRFRETLECDPNNALAMNNIAWYELTSPELTPVNRSAILARARRAYELQPKDINIIGTLALAELQAGDCEVAYRLAQDGQAVEKGDVWTLVIGGQAAVALGRTVEAGDMRQRAGEQVIRKNDPVLKALYDELVQRLNAEPNAPNE